MYELFWMKTLVSDTVAISKEEVMFCVSLCYGRKINWCRYLYF